MMTMRDHADFEGYVPYLPDCFVNFFCFSFYINSIFIALSYYVILCDEHTQKHTAKFNTFLSTK